MSVSLISASLRERILRGDIPAWVTRNPRTDYIVQVVLSCPPWVDRRELRKLEREAAFRSAATGVKHVVDHVVPVTHPLVCGLTVPWNLRVITAAANAKKSNGLHHAFQAELFDEPEQLALL